MMGKTKDSAQSLSKLIREKVKLRKIYLARVAGRFPSSDCTFPNRLRGLPIIENNQGVQTLGIHCAPSGDDDLSFLKSVSSSEAANATVCTVHCPLRCADRKNGKWECCVDGKDDAKSSTTRVRFLSYHSESRTSLVYCEPVTGRTHQIRLALQSLGHPIANDPNYGGVIKCAPRVHSPASRNSRPVNASNADERGTVYGK